MARKTKRRLDFGRLKRLGRRLRRRRAPRAATGSARQTRAPERIEGPQAARASTDADA
jgi:hypothetical protein